MLLKVTAVFLAILFLMQTVVCGQTSTIPSTSVQQTLDPAKIQRIITAFTNNETKFRQKLNRYQFRREAKLQKIGSEGLGPQITGEYYRESLFSFDDAGQRYEKILRFPMPTGGMNQIVTQEDLDDLGGIQPFALESSKISQYDFKYVGKEKIDELNLYVFDVAPKIMPNPKKSKERYFVGRVWVEDEGLQIVKTKGRAVPETDKNKFPIFETYRENIDGKYWFPTYTYADEILEYPTSRLHIRMTVKYSDFKEYKGKAPKITEIDQP